MRLNELMTTHFITGRGEGGGELWVRSHISNFLSEFRCRFSRGSLVLLSFFLYLEGNSPYARIFGSFGEHYYFFFSDNFACMILFCFSRTSPSLF